MEVSSITSQSNEISTKKDIVDKNVFLKILAVELSNQDPLNAKDNTQYISQLAQFTSLEQTANLNSAITKILQSQRLTEGAMLIGRTVDFILYDGNDNSKIISDVVKSVKVEKDNVYLMTESGRYRIDDVVGVGDAEVDK